MKKYSSEECIRIVLERIRDLERQERMGVTEGVTELLEANRKVLVAISGINPDREEEVTQSLQ